MYSAYELLKKGEDYKVILFEKEKELGGRMLTEEIHIDGQTFNIEGGAGVIRSDEDIVIDLCKELNVQLKFWSSPTDMVYHNGEKDPVQLLERVCKEATDKKSFVQAVDDSNLDPFEKVGVLIGTSYSELFTADATNVCDYNDWTEFFIPSDYQFGKPVLGWKDLVEKLQERIIELGGSIYPNNPITEISKNYIMTHKEKVYYDDIIITTPHHHSASFYENYEIISCIE